MQKIIFHRRALFVAFCFNFLLILLCIYNYIFLHFSTNNDKFLLNFSPLDSNPSYAKITRETTLFRTQDTLDTSLNNIYFTLPKSYFVKLLSVSNTSVCVEYNDIVGYTNADDLLEVDFVPSRPYDSNRTLSIKSDSSTYLKSAPTISSTTYKILSPTTTLTYIGSVSGEIPSDGSSNTWYFVTISESETKVHYGYVYSERTENLSTFTENYEGITSTEPTTPTYSNDVVVLDSDTSEEIITMSTTTKWILITLLTLPVIIIFVLLIKKPSSKQNDDDNENKKSKKVKENKPLPKSSKIYEKLFKEDNYPNDDELL